MKETTYTFPNEQGLGCWAGWKCSGVQHAKSHCFKYQKSKQQNQGQGSLFFVGVKEI